MVLEGAHGMTAERSNANQSPSRAKPIEKDPTNEDCGEQGQEFFGQNFIKWNCRQQVFNYIEFGIGSRLESIKRFQFVTLTVEGRSECLRHHLGRRGSDQLVDARQFHSSFLRATTVLGCHRSIGLSVVDKVRNSLLINTIRFI